MADAEFITVPRPAPDEAVIAVCDENGARCYITGKKTTFADGSFLPQILPFLAEGQQNLYEKRAAASHVMDA